MSLYCTDLAMQLWRKANHITFELINSPQVLCFLIYFPQLQR